MPITSSQVDISVDDTIHEVITEDHEPIIVTLPDPRSTVTTSQENNEVDCQESTGDASDGAKDTLLDQPQMTTRSKSRNDNNPVSVGEPEPEHIPTREGLRNKTGKDSTWRSQFENQLQNTLITDDIQRPRDFERFTEEEDYASKCVFTQMSMKKGIKEFGDDAAKAIITEFT